MKDAPFIFVCERGMVLVGRVVEEDTLSVTLNDCAIIRRWGTTKGLGQLAIEGPKTETVFDPEPDGTKLFKMGNIYRQIPCNQKKWEKFGD